MSTYKIEVSDHGDDEVNRLAVAYAAMRGLHPRCMKWLRFRIECDRINDWAAAQDAAKLQKLDRK